MSRSVRQRAAATDRRLLAAAARHRGPVIDRVMRTASHLADRSAMWSAIAFALTATGERRPRNAAASGLLGIGIAATLVNGPLKFWWRRDRPPAGAEPLLALPRTFSFPSGHAASAAAFATGASLALPEAAPWLMPAAATVAYSRVHTGVHYPSDVVVGAAVGAGAGAAGARIVRGLRDRSVQHPRAVGSNRPVPRRVLVVANQQSGTAAGLKPALVTLAEAGFTLERTVPIGEVGTLADLIGDDRPLVLAAGGDGTVSAVAQAVRDLDVVVGVLPLGTSNDVARSLGIPPDPVEAARAIASGWVGAVDVGDVRCGDDAPRAFVNAVTVGLNVAFAKLAGDHTLRDRFGGLTYPVAAARAVRGYQPFRCRLEHDGNTRTLDLVHLSVSNAPVFGGVLGMRVPKASIVDGALDVIAIERLSLARLSLAVADTLVGQHRPVHRVHALKAASVWIEAPDDQDVAIDGEVAGALPAEFAIRPGGLSVVLPRRG